MHENAVVHSAEAYPFGSRLFSDLRTMCAAGTLSRACYERPSPWAHLVGFVLKIGPKVGPLRAFAFRAPTVEGGATVHGQLRRGSAAGPMDLAIETWIRVCPRFAASTRCAMKHTDNSSAKLVRGEIVNPVNEIRADVISFTVTHGRTIKAFSKALVALRAGGNSHPTKWANTRRS
jgi:hypothetical protein